MRAVIVGAGVGGLATALRLGRAGHDVVVIDRDPAPPGDVADAFGGWRRRSVRQWQQYHVFRSRARRELAQSAPDVLERLAEVGVPGAPRVEHGAAHGGFRGLAVRRPVLEWVLHREVIACRRVRLLSATAVSAVSIDRRRRCITGVCTADGSTIAADVVVDAAGRRSPIRAWTAAAGFECPPEDRTDCRIAYYTRYYRAHPERGAPRLEGAVEVGDDGFMGHALAIGDNSTMGAIFVVPADRVEFRALGSVPGWDAAIAQIPRMAELLTERLRKPVTGPAAMYGLENAIVGWQADGLHGPRRLAAVGDSWLVTNPNLAWGSSIALAHGFALADAVDAHGADVDSAIADYRARCIGEVEQLYAAACEADRALHARWRLSSAPRRADDLHREALLFGLTRLARHGDVDVARRLAHRADLLELPDALWNDEPLLARARASLQARPYDPDRRDDTIDEEQFLAAVESARAGSATSSDLGPLR